MEDKLELDLYHTQEFRGTILSNPIKCIRNDAWLGDGYYFWYYEDDAMMWGNKSKKRTKKYDIYKARIVSEDVLNTVFNEDHYIFWVKQIELVSKKIIKQTQLKPTLKEINDYFKDKGIWSEIDGILFQDISKDPVKYLVKEMQYKKRIQFALYNKNKMTNFAHHFTGDCN